MIFHIGGEEREIGPGDGYNVPGGVVHGATGHHRSRRRRQLPPRPRRLPLRAVLRTDAEAAIALR